MTMYFPRPSIRPHRQRPAAVRLDAHRFGSGQAGEAGPEALDERLAAAGVAAGFSLVDPVIPENDRQVAAGLPIRNAFDVEQGVAFIEAAVVPFRHRHWP